MVQGINQRERWDRRKASAESPLKQKAQAHTASNCAILRAQDVLDVGRYEKVASGTSLIRSLVFRTLASRSSFHDFHTTLQGCLRLYWLNEEEHAKKAENEIVLEENTPLR